MLDLLKQDLTKQGVFSGELPPLLEHIANSINNRDIPYRMKVSIAVSELVLFASHLRRNIAHWNGSSIPINSITFSIAQSGAGKDSSVNAVRKCFKEAYELVNKRRKQIATEKAIRAAKADGKPNPEEFGSYSAYYIKPNPLFVAPSTTEGLIQHLNDLESAGTGAGFLYTGEFGAELANSSVLVDNIKLLAEMYDEGSKEVKVLKNRENQSREIKNLPISALFVGSQDNLLYDEAIKRKFKTEFSTKLARRSFFNFNPDKIEPIQYSSVDEMLEKELELEEQAVISRQQASASITQIAKANINSMGTSLSIDEDTVKLFIKYKRYNEEMADTIKAQYPIAKLSRSHLQWKALKLAGAIAIFNGNDSITFSDYVYAISYCEMLDKDMVMFEQELVKEPYEVFVDYMHKHAEAGKHNISLHVLRKLGYIPTSGTPLGKMKELTHLASSYDKTGLYTCTEEGISYEELIETDITGVSYLYQNGLSKQERAKHCTSGFQFFETDFSELSEMLKEDIAYATFAFKDGVRGKDNITNGCKIIVLDVDSSTITDAEAHFMLSDVNHHIARTSDASNPFKFRVIIELDSIVDIPDIQWKYFITSIADELALKVDVLPKSQIYFAYAGRNVLSTLDASPLEAKPHLMHSAEVMANKALPAKKLSTAQQQALLNDKLSTFQYAFECTNGSGSRSLIRAAYHAKDLGASLTEIENLMFEINNYWVDPMDEDRLEKTILSQIRRWS